MYDHILNLTRRHIMKYVQLVETNTPLLATGGEYKLTDKVPIIGTSKYEKRHPKVPNITNSETRRNLLCTER